MGAVPRLISIVTMSRPDSAPSSAPREWIALALLMASAAWLQRAALGTAFFADDYLFLDQVRGLGFFQALASPDPLGNFLRPVSRQVYFWLLAALGRETPGIFHVVNFALFLGALALLFRIARKVAGALAATVATAIIALHYSADVPLRWASGSQDLLALVFSLGAILLHLRQRRIAAAICYLLALLSKETVLLTPLVAWALEEAGGKHASPRGMTSKPAAPRAAHLIPMAVCFLAWAALWLATRSSRPAAGSTLHLDPAGLPAAAVHFLQSLSGLEWGTDGLLKSFVLPPLVPILLAVAAVIVAAGGPRRSEASREVTTPTARSAALSATILWAVCGLLPVMLVAPIWSAYYYLFALCGAAIAIGILCADASASRGAIASVVVIVFSTLSARASARREFAMTASPWATQSHLTRYYIERSLPLVRHLLDQLERAHPRFPPHTTLFFGGVPPNAGWQAGDGALFRRAYHDTTLRSYFIAGFTRARGLRGPNYFFDVSSGELIELWPDRVPYAPLALNLLLDERRAAARDAMSLELETKVATPQDAYLMAWMEFDAGDRSTAARLLAALGFPLDPNPAPEVGAIVQMVTVEHDTIRAIPAIRAAIQRHPFDPGAHALLADLLLLQSGAGDPQIVIEAFAALALAPDQGSTWRRWAQLQLLTARYRQAKVSLDRYFELGGEDAAKDAEALGWRERLRRFQPGGELAERSLRQPLTSRPK